MNFNRIKEMARSIEDIEKSLENSEMLELSRDKQSVRRVTAVQQKPNVDECTVYVVSIIVYFELDLHYFSFFSDL